MPFGDETNNDDKKLTITFKTNASINNTIIITGEDHLKKIFPWNFAIDVTEFETSDDTFVYITGDRCKWMCDRTTKKCGSQSCWNTPTLCLGDVETCLKHDELSNGWYKVSSDHTEKEATTGDEFYFTNLEIAKYVYKNFESIRSKAFVSKNGNTNLLPSTFHHWNCNESDESHFICTIPERFAAPGFGLLKTIAG